MLESVSAGVISVDPMGVVRLMNSTAQRLLQTEVAHCLGCTLSDIAPPFARLVGEGTGKAVIQYSRENDLLTLAVRVVREPYGIVITFEDITQQLVDQRQAAWSDARAGSRTRSRTRSPRSSSPPNGSSGAMPARSARTMRPSAS